MPIVAMPDGTQVQFPDDMPDEQIRALIQKKFPETDPAMGGTAYQFARGAVQGAVLDPVEGIGQLVEWASGKKIPIPQGVRDWFDKVRERSEATTAGKAGRVTGLVGSLAAAPESVVARVGGGTAARVTQLAKPLGTAAKMKRRGEYARALGKKSAWDLTNAERAESDLGRMPVPAKPGSGLARLAGQTATGAAVGAAQPLEPGVSDEDFATRKAAQAVAGGLFAGVPATGLGRLANYATRHHPWATSAAVFHPHSSIPTLAMLSALYGVRGLETAGPRAAAPLGAAAGRALSGAEEAPDAETE